MRPAICFLIALGAASGCGHAGWVRSKPCTHGTGQFLTIENDDIASASDIPGEPVIVKVTVHNAVSFDANLTLTCDGVVTPVKAEANEDITIPIEASRPPLGALPRKLSCELGDTGI